jgi:hypothetical protein
MMMIPLILASLFHRAGKRRGFRDQENTTGTDWKSVLLNTGWTRGMTGAGHACGENKALAFGYPNQPRTWLGQNSMTDHRFDRTVRSSVLASLPLPRTSRPTRVTAWAAAALSARKSASGVRPIYSGRGSLGKDGGAWMLAKRIESLLSIPVTRTPCTLATHTATVCKFLTAIGASGDKQGQIAPTRDWFSAFSFSSRGQAASLPHVCASPDRLAACPNE